MISSRVSLSMSHSRSSELSSIGSCSDSEVVDFSISNSNVDAQAAWTDADGPSSSTIRTADEGSKEVQADQIAEEGRRTRCQGFGGSQEHLGNGQSIRGTQWLATSLIDADNSRGGATEQVHVFPAITATLMLSFRGLGFPRKEYLATEER